MSARKIMISADSFRFAVADVVARPLRSDCYAMPIVERVPSGLYEIVDGHKRIAGLIAGGADEIECVLCDDEDLIAVAGNAERPDAQREAIAAIYASVN